MAHAFQIDTLAFSKRLRAAGADEKLAEAIVEGITGADTSELATKADIAGVRNEIKNSELRMTIRLGSIMAVGIGVIGALVLF
jgi:uncharacterized membrane protein YheB (UPF0754 family)